MKILKKNFILFIAALLIVNCGFKVLDKSQLQNLKIESLETQGDKKTSFLIKSSLQKYFTNNENGENILFEEFIKLMEQVENKLARDDPNNNNR